MPSTLIDMQSLENFTKDDPELLADLAVIFARFLPGSLAQLHLSIENRDARLLRETAHQLKSQLSYFFCEPLIEQARQLEELGKDGHVRDAYDLATDIQTGIERLLSELSLLTSLDLQIEED